MTRGVQVRHPCTHHHEHGHRVQRGLFYMHVQWVIEVILWALPENSTQPLHVHGESVHTGKICIARNVGIAIKVIKAVLQT